MPLIQERTYLVYLFIKTIDSSLQAFGVRVEETLDIERRPFPGSLLKHFFLKLLVNMEKKRLFNNKNCYLI